MVTLRPETRVVPRHGGPIRVLVADDHDLFAKTIEAMLAGDSRIEVVGRACDGEEAVRVALELEPDVVLMDLDMPRLNGFEATAKLLATCEPCNVLVLTASHAPENADRAFQVGATGYLTKDRIATELLPAILAVAETGGKVSADGGADLAGRAHVG